MRTACVTEASPRGPTDAALRLERDLDGLRALSKG